MMKLMPSEKKSIMTSDAVVLDRDWNRERAHALSMAGRGVYR
jgi:hypothetical protein